MLTAGKTYSSIVDMCRDSIGDEFADELELQIARREFCRRLMVQRAVKNLTAAEIAVRMGVSEETVNSIEFGLDADVDLEAVRQYLNALFQ